MATVNKSSTSTNHAKLVSLLLRLSIASVFLYASVAATLQPYNWIGYMPQALYHIAPPDMLLIGFSIFQFVLVAWILSGWKAFYAASVAGVTLVAIITANWGDLDVLFRDFAIFFAALALAAASYKKK